MSKAIFFGDSFTSGENNDGISYVDYLELEGSIINAGVSGTTIGNYSIYPVGDEDLLSKLRCMKDTVSKCDKVFIEYGINDAVSAALGYVDITRVRIDLRKALDLLSQINPDAKVGFIGLTSAGIHQACKLQAKYLSEYYSVGVTDDPVMLDYMACKIESAYSVLVLDVCKYASVQPYFIIDSDAMSLYLSDDNIHPTDEGYRKIASNFMEYAQEGVSNENNLD